MAIELEDYLTSLAADSSPARAADYVMTYDASAAELKKVLLNLITPLSWSITCSDRVTPITPATNNIMSWPVPYDITLTEVQAYLTDAAATGTFTVRIKQDGASILSTNITIDATEQNSTGAAVPPVISTAALTRGSEITIDVTDDADGTASGLIVTLIGVKA